MKYDDDAAVFGCRKGTKLTHYVSGYIEIDVIIFHYIISASVLPDY